MKRLRVTDFGPLREADVKFGDLTVLVGPNASGKSLFVQLYKLLEDAPAIASELARYGFDWREEANPLAAFSSLYFGAGLESIFGKTTRIARNGRPIEPGRLANLSVTSRPSTVFVIPAQRVLVLQDGWPKPFMGYGTGDPYAIRKFSESIRALSGQLNGQDDMQELILVPDFKTVVDAAIYAGSKLDVKREGMRQQVVLKPSGSSSGLPYSAWSAGQREFTPLLLGLSFFKSTWAGKLMTTVILEEPEMGLHPQGVITMGLLILESLARGRRVIVSTHSPVILDLVWAIREMSSIDPEVAIDALCKIFGIVKPSQIVLHLFNDALRSSYRTYFFNRTDSGVVTQDISTLDPGDEDENIAGWGGLSGFSGRIARIVAEAVSR